MIRILMAATDALARGTDAAITIEAEYGRYVHEGSLYTAAHHQPSGPYRGRHAGGSRPAPCNDPEIPVIEDGTIVVSHLDLDTVGGILRAMGDPLMHRHPGFWNLVERVDVEGAHTVALDHPIVVNVLAPWWAWLTRTRPALDRKKIVNATGWTLQARRTLQALLPMAESDVPAGLLDLRQSLRAEGDLWRENMQEANRLSFRAVVQGVEHDGEPFAVIVREHDEFVNHLYASPLESTRDIMPDGVCSAVVGYQTDQQKVTLSFAAGDKQPLYAPHIMQAVFPDRDDEGNPLAGGHHGIAGSPRGRVCSIEDAWRVVQAVLEAHKADGAWGQT